jgi:hypothetical protein
MTREIDKGCRFHKKGDGSRWLTDAAGIPLCRVCDKCRKVRMAGFRPEIFRVGSVYSMTGDEVDILDSPESYRNG